jgi:hypothetical protein
MRKNMKLTGLAVCLTCCAGFINAQEANELQERQQQEKHLPREVLIDFLFIFMFPFAERRTMPAPLSSFSAHREAEKMTEKRGVHLHE